MNLDTVVCGDCLDILPTIPDASVDAVITDPPYPHIKRDYGKWTTEEWWAMMVEGVVPEVRRILKPTGSAVFILQPNSEKVGKMRGWLWEFMAWVCREWNMVQDVWWWNVSALPMGGATTSGFLRASIKACIWVGAENCYHNQDNVLWLPAQQTMMMERTDRIRASIKGREIAASGNSINRKQVYDTIQKRGGVTPFNIIPIGTDAARMADKGITHGAGTPLALMDWWLRYIVPSGGLVVDPFMGSGTTAVAAIKQRKHFFGCDTVPEYVDICNMRIVKAREETAQMELAL